MPISSTVIPLPVYKVGFGVGVNGARKKPTKADEAPKLITGIFMPNKLLFHKSCTLKRMQSISQLFTTPGIGVPFFFLQVCGTAFKAAYFLTNVEL